MYNANIKTIPHSDQLYDTIGDWRTEGGCIQFRVSSMGNADYEFLVALHEMIEKQLCRKVGITEQMVDAWDLSHEDAEEPGALEDCPYREQHMIAEAIERTVAVKLGVDWNKYTDACRAVVAREILKEPPVRDTVLIQKVRRRERDARKRKLNSQVGQTSS